MDWSDATTESPCHSALQHHNVAATVTEFTLTSTEITGNIRNGFAVYTGVRAFSGEGNARVYSDWVPSSPASVTPSASPPPTTPRQVSVRRSATADSIDVSWTAPPDLGTYADRL